jgi:SNF2 family DNA or RNA helicase
VSTATKTLFAHQLEAADFITQRNGIGALYMQCGTGKTVSTLESFRRLKERQPGLKMIVTAPLSLLNTAWRDDVADFTNFSYHNAHDEGIPSVLKADIMSINFDVVAQNKELLRRIIRDNMLVVDESSKLKDHNSQISKTMLNLAPDARYRLDLSGTPAPNSPLEYWPQIDFLWPGYLGTFSQFRNQYFHLSRGDQWVLRDGIWNPQFLSQMINRKQIKPEEADLLIRGYTNKTLMAKIMRVGPKYAITNEKLAHLMATIAPLCFWKKKKDCLDLPDQMDEVREIEMTADQARHYHQMENDLITQIRGMYITAPVALAKIMKLREITSGFAYDGMGNEVEIGNSPKIKELDQLLDELGDEHSIIWFNFKWEAKKICALLADKYGADSFVTYHADTKDKDSAADDFKHGRVRFMVAHPQSSAHGLNFQHHCHYEIFFSLTYSYEQYEQGRDRIHRAGQNKKCTYFHLIAKDSIDEKIYDVLKKKGDMMELGYQLMQKAGRG